MVQGRHVRRKALKLLEPPGDRQGVIGRGQPLRLLVTGDSAAAGVGADTQEEGLLGNILSGLIENFEVEYRLIARTGARTISTVRRLSRLEPIRYDIAVTSLGVNDVTSGLSLTNWLNQQRQLIDLLRNHYSVQQIILSGLPPMAHFPLLPQPLRWYLGRESSRFDRALRKLALELECEHVSLEVTEDQSLIASDGFHPGPGVYKLWGKEVASRVCQRMTLQ